MTLVLGDSNDESGLEAEYLRVMGEHRVDGLILVPTDQAATTIAQRLPEPVPLVLVDRGLVGVAADVVRCDTGTATGALCRHLIDLGHRRIAIVGGLPSAPTWNERVAGCRAALAAAGLPTPDDLVVSGNYRAAGGIAAVHRLYTQGERPDAIIAANSQVALGVLDELTARGLRVPEDVAVATIDDPLPPSAFWPRLTVVEQPGYEMGRTAIELLISRMDPACADAPPREVVFAASLKLGVSCGERR